MSTSSTTAARRVLVLQGHPDASARHFGHALADADAEGAAVAGHEVRRLDIAARDIPVLRSQREWHEQPVPPRLAPAREAIAHRREVGMPAAAYRWWFGAHGVKSLERSILGLVGIAPVHETFVGHVEDAGGPARLAWLDRLPAPGRGAG